MIRLANDLLRAARLAVHGVPRLVETLYEEPDTPPEETLDVPRPPIIPLPPYPEFYGPLREIPGPDDIVKVYGDPNVTYRRGKVVVDPRWERQNMLLVRGLPIVGKLYVHKLVAPYLREALRRAERATFWRPGKVGCFAPRHQRHNRRRPLSDHTWGIAVDCADPDGKFRRVSKSMPDEWGRAFESVGFEWGRRWETFRDDMHFSLRRTR